MKNTQAWSNSCNYAKILFFLNLINIISRVILYLTVLPVLLFVILWTLLSVYGFIFEKGDYNLSLETFSLLSPKTSDYSSGDLETDIIVNYYAGKKDVGRDWKVMQFYQDTLFQLNNSISGSDEKKDSIVGIINKFKSMSYEEFDKYLMERSLDIEKRFYFASDSVNREVTYQTIWKIYLSLGSPKLKYCPNSKVFPMQYADSFYDPFNQKILLTKLLDANIDSIKNCYTWNPDIFLEELGHAKQFKEKPARSLSKYFYGMLYSRLVSAWSYVSEEKNKSWNSAYSSEYIRRGSFEREAHLELGGYYKNIFYSTIFSPSYEDLCY